MKPEPLKDKTQSHCHKKDLTDRHDIHDDKDIKSAVEWLKEELKRTLIGVDGQITKVISQAFEDVTK